MIYRRGVSVIISPSLSCPTLGNVRLSRTPSPSPPPNPSICTLPATVIAVARARISPRIGPARSGAPLNGRVVFQLCRRASFTIPLLYCFRELPASLLENGGGFARGRYILSLTTTTTTFDLPALFSGTTEIPGVLVPLFLSSPGSNRGVSRRR